MNCFKQFVGLSEHLLASLQKMKFDTPTPIQAQAIPLALAGKDILGSAQTGTGKTGAFAIPLMSKILNNEIHSALILTPTRELAVQVLGTIHQLIGMNRGIHTALLIGGESMPNQFRQLRKNPRIIVGTPGRINDHLERGTVDITKTNFLVLDETDRMLDMGFGRQIDSIVAHLPQQIQTLMFSATMPKNIMQMASKYLKDPKRIEIGSSLKPLEAIAQESIRIAEDQKYTQLVKELDIREGSVVVFVKTKYGAKKIAEKLYRDNFEADAIHGNLRQNKRDFVIRKFRESKIRILVATDVAARGLDVPHVQHVINHDLPQCPEDYIHRIGRTARAGATGKALNFITSKEDRLWRAIERFMKTGEQAQQNRSSQNFGSSKARRGGFGSRGFGNNDRNNKRRHFSGRSNRFEEESSSGGKFKKSFGKFGGDKFKKSSNSNGFKNKKFVHTSDDNN